MSSESGQRLPMEELKRRNAPQPIPTQTCPSKEEWQELLHRLDELERHTAAHTALLREVSSGKELYPTQEQLETLSRGANVYRTETGWEEERDIYLAARFGYGAVRTGLAAPAGDAGGHGGLADHLVRLGRSLERGQGADPVKDSTTTPHRSDRKTLRREQEKKTALGHKEDDHEEEQTWQQTMG